jgi:predicted nucleic acid-binding protein
LKRFVDTNVFIYSVTSHPKFGKIAQKILNRLEKGEECVTSTIVLCEVAWVLEAMGKQSYVKPTLEKILSYNDLSVLPFDSDDLLVGANNMLTYGIDFNDAVNVSVMSKVGINQVYSNDKKHLGKIKFLALVFE